MTSEPEPEPHAAHWLRRAAKKVVAFLASPARLSLAGLAVFTVFFFLCFLMALPDSWTCSGAGYIQYNRGFAADTPQRIELACAGIAFGCFLHQLTHLYKCWMRYRGTQTYHQSLSEASTSLEICFASTVSFLILAVAFGTRSSDVLPWACSQGIAASSAVAFYPMDQIVSMVTLPPLFGAVVLYCGGSEGVVALLSLLTFFSSLADSLVDIVSSSGLWWFFAAAGVLTSVAEFCVLAYMVVLLRKSRSSDFIAVAISACFLLVLLLQATFTLVFLLKPTSASFQRSYWASSETAYRVLLTVPFVLADMRQEADDLLAGLRSIEVQRAAAEAANNSQKLFTRWLFHELRVPMQAMVLSISELQELLQPQTPKLTLEPLAAPGGSEPAEEPEPSLIEQQRQCAATAQAGAAQVCKLLNSVLSLAKIEAGKTRLELAPFNVAQELVRGTAAMFHSMLERQHIRLVTHIAPSIAAVVVGDASKLKMALANFLSNAIKFSPRGGIITVVVEGVSVPTSQLLQSIADPEPRPWVEYPATTGGGSLPRVPSSGVIGRDASSSIFKEYAPHRSRLPSRGPYDRIPSHDSDSVSVTVPSLATADSASPPPPSGRAAYMPGFLGAMFGFTRIARVAAEQQQGNATNISPTADGTTGADDLKSVEKCLRLSVTDNGMGIPMADMRGLFHPFVQVRSTHVHATSHDNVSQAQGSSGLGLSLCQRMVELCGGRVGVASQQGVGSTFWLEVPVADADGQIVTAVASALRRFSSQMIRVAASENGVPLESGVTPVRRASRSRIDDDSGSLSLLPTFRTTSGYFSASRQPRPPRPAVELLNPRPDGIPSLGTSMSLSPHNDTSRAEPRSGVTAAVSLSPLRPLLWAAAVDDIASNLMMMARIMTRRGVRVLLTAVHGADCLGKLHALPAEQQALLRTSPSAAWFLDKTMPVMDGPELTRRLRSQQSVTAAIFAVTADALEEDKAAYVAIGACAVITKPCTPDSIAAALADFGLRWPTKEESAAAAAQPLGPP